MIKIILDWFKNALKRNKEPELQRCSYQGIELIKTFEGFEPEPYKCPAGKLTIGYGHAIQKDELLAPAITEEEAEALLKEDLSRIESYIHNRVTSTLTQGQFDALCSLIYNWGSGAFSRSKGLKLLNAGRYTAASLEFFSKEKGVVKIKGKFSEGLHRRRQAELDLWDTNC